ncbi:hypothetical protein B0I35DRAFT_449760 [Stachybotrys elegans]|uniref:ABM domain-containing protein n=1 Tax=Stachybotrys elegans TaxID=80388 RepID=A0A8K0WVE8_9HYPO|nr:hypothetical protein B0I35DRAFT_449760 [Stachybotrys elegans]
MALEGISLHVSVTISPENVTRFFEFFKPVYEAVIAEPECSFFEVYQSPEDPGALHWVENWSQSVEWLIKVQLTKPYYQEYLEATEPMFIKPREFKVVHHVEGYSYAETK